MKVSTLRPLVSVLFAACIYLAVTAQAVNSEESLMLWYDKPATKFEEALPIGNGGLGAMIYGSTAKERVQFNRDRLFSGKPHDYAHKGAVKFLPELRKLLFDGKQNEAHSLGNREFMSVSPRGNNRQEAYKPFGDIELLFNGHESVTDYKRSLNIEDATASVEYKVNDTKYKREYFASYPDDAIVIQISADKKCALDLTVNLTSPHAGAKQSVIDDSTLTISGPVDKSVLTHEAHLQVRIDKGEIKPAGSSLQISKADSVTLILTGYSSYVNFQDVSANPAELCKETLKKLKRKNYKSLRSAHIKDYQRLFDTCTIDFGVTDKVKLPTDQRIKSFGPDDPHLAALFFQYGRYLLISCSRPGHEPANLQGIWNDKMKPPWDSKYTININTEMNYWPAELTGLSECHEPLFDALKDLSVTGASVAKEHYGARGWVVHHNFDLWRGAAPINNANHGIWVTGGAWLSQHLWWRYHFTGDKEFLADTAYPLLKGISLFFLDYLIEDPKGKEKYLISGPSNSPETGGLVMGPTMDHQIIRSILRNTAQAAKILAVDKDLQEQWLKTADRIAPNQIGSGGQLKEWFYKENYKTTHRHVSHLWGLHPGLEIHPRKTPKLSDACKVTLKNRGDGGTGWSKAWKINFWARLLDGDHSYKMLAEALRGNTYPNMFDAHPPFQIDGNFGATSGIAEMLMQSDGEEINLLAALPSALPKGKVTGLRARGGFIVDLEWEPAADEEKKTLLKAEITSLAGNPMNVRYRDEILELKLSKGKSKKLSFK